MPNVMPTQAFGDPVPEGRAADIVRGVQRMMGQLGFATLTEMTLASGRRADVLGLSSKGEIVIVEVKSCLNDFNTDQKWPEYADFCDRFFFAVDTDFPHDRLPEAEGYIVADQFGGAIVREAREDRISGARRKAVTLSFARLSAARLLRTTLQDPAAEVEGVATDPDQD